MRFTTSFIIRPKPELDLRLGITDPRSVSSVQEPIHWTCGTSDRVAWTKEEFIEGVKELFLSHLQTDFLTPAECERLQITSACCPSEFDRYWNLEVFDGADERVEDVVASRNNAFRDSRTNRFLQAMAQSIPARAQE